MAESDLIDFQTVLSTLQISETELQNLVARGDLRAYRSGGAMKFRRQDVESLKSERETEPTIIIPPGEPAAAAPINLDTGANLVIEEPAPVGGSADAGLEILPTEDSASAEEITIIAPDVVGGGPVDGEAGTEAEITIVDEEAAVPVESVDEGSAVEPERRSVSQRVSSIRHRAAVEEAPGHPIMSGIMVVTAALIFFTISILVVVLRWDVWRPHFGTDGGERFVPRYLSNMETSAEQWALPNKPKQGEGAPASTTTESAPATPATPAAPAAPAAK